MNKYKGYKKARQQYSREREEFFEKFCQRNGITCISLEKDLDARKKYLKDPNGKCPDYVCIKNGKVCFVEIKTHTLVTNKARETQMQEESARIKKQGIDIAILSPAYDPTPELKVPFSGYLKDTSNKFKNIKGEYDYPRVLLIDGFHVDRYDILAIFSGIFDAVVFNQNREPTHTVQQKQERGLFDSTGSSVSGVVYWSSSKNRYEGLINHNGKNPLSEEDFKHFFS